MNTTNNLFTIAVTIFYIVWLIAVLIFMWLIWRSNTKHIRQMEQTLVNVAMMDAESARQAIDSARILTDSMHNLIAMLQKDRLNDTQ